MEKIKCNIKDKYYIEESSDVENLFEIKFNEWDDAVLYSYVLNVIKEKFLT